MSKNIIRPLWLLLSVPLFFMSCMPYEEEILREINLDYKDPILQKIFSYQDQQLTDSIYPYFHHSDPTYRYAAVVAFGSHKNTESLDSLTFMLNDRIPEVRAGAAYAIGQLGAPEGVSPLIAAFDQTDTAGLFQQSNRAILEAVGKCGQLDALKALTSISTYTPKDTMLLEGQAWGIYRFGLRKLILPKGTDLMLQYASDTLYPNNVRFIAANYLYRVPNLELSEEAAQQLSRVLIQDKDPRIRMAIAIALGKTKSPTALFNLLTKFNTETDYRVKSNIISALGNFNYGQVQELIFSALRSPDLAVAQRAVQFLIDHGVAQDATFYWRTAKDSLPWQIQIGLYKAANRHLPVFYEDFKSYINNELRARFSGSDSPYEKKAVLDALAEYGWNFRFIHRVGFPASHPAVRTASISALSSIAQKPNFNQYFGQGNRQVSRELAAFFSEAIRSEDVGMMAEGAIALRNPDRTFKNYIDSLNFMHAALAKLELPKEVETYNELKATINYFENNSTDKQKAINTSHKIRWDLLQNFKKGSVAEILTNKGTIKMELLPDLAPGTVANFIELIQQGYYSGKNFHRVVPNFVIQGGCSRGDGYGSLDYTIRSELPPIHYDRAGYVGMASAGNHTESSQFFITHSPTPHLDGNYTIFAKVIEGLEVVNQIQVGDKIQGIVLN